MATADPSIFNALMPRKSAFDYANEFEQQDMRREQQGMARQQNALALEQARRQQAQAEAANALQMKLRTDIGSLGPAPTDEQLGSVYLRHGAVDKYMDVRKSGADLAYKRAQTAKEAAEAGAKTWEQRQKERNQAVLDLVNFASPQEAVANIQERVQGGLLPPQVGQGLIASLQGEQNFDAWRMKVIRGMMSATDQVQAQQRDQEIGLKRDQFGLQANNEIIGPDGRVNQQLLGAKQQVARAGASSVNISTGQKGLDNEFKLRGEFKQEPVYKAHQEMQAAYSQIQQALKQATPAGDLAGATKIMKLLDPNSVVRESELGMAIAATGLLDRVQNYASNIISGNKLTPKQRTEFQALADALMSESVKHYNSKRSEYERLGGEYGLNAPRALGPSAAPTVTPATAGPTLRFDANGNPVK